MAKSRFLKIFLQECTGPKTPWSGTLQDVLSYFFYKEITQQIVRETYRNAEYKKARGSIFSFWSFVRSWTTVRINKIYSFMSVLRGTVTVGGGGGQRERNISNCICQCDYWSIIWIDLHIFAFHRHWDQHTKDLANFSQFILCYVTWP
jgi:hypothetical protein